MKIDQLSYFLETAKQEHLGKAAKKLAISPSAISHSITALEQTTGKKLFDKRGKNIFLTAHGKYLAEKVAPILEMIQELKEDISSDTLEHKGHYKIVATHGLNEMKITPLFSEMLMRYSEVTAEVLSLRSADVIKEVTEHNADLGFCFSPQDNINFNSLKLIEGELVFAVRKKHPILCLPEKKRFEELNKYKMASAKAFAGIENCQTHPIFQKLGLNPKPQVFFDSAPAYTSAIEHSDFFAFVPDYFIDAYSDRITSVGDTGGGAPYSIAAIWPSSRIPTKFLLSFIEVIKNSFYS